MVTWSFCARQPVCPQHPRLGLLPPGTRSRGLEMGSHLRFFTVCRPWEPSPLPRCCYSTYLPGSQLCLLPHTSFLQSVSTVSTLSSPLLVPAGSTVPGAGTPGSQPTWLSSTTCTWTAPSGRARCACASSSSCAMSAARRGWTSRACWRRTSNASWTISSPACVSSATESAAASTASTWPAARIAGRTAASSARPARRALCTGSPARSC